MASSFFVGAVSVWVVVVVFSRVVTRSYIGPEMPGSLAIASIADRPLLLSALVRMKFPRYCCQLGCV